MEVWAREIKNGGAVSWSGEGQMLVLRTFVLTEGTRALVKVTGGCIGKTATCASLTKTSPNFAADLPFMEGISILVTGDDSAKVSIIGFQQVLEDESDCESEGLSSGMSGDGYGAPDLVMDSESDLEADGCECGECENDHPPFTIEEIIEEPQPIAIQDKKVEEKPAVSKAEKRKNKKKQSLKQVTKTETLKAETETETQKAETETETQKQETETVAEPAAKKAKIAASDAKKADSGSSTCSTKSSTVTLTGEEKVSPVGIKKVLPGGLSYEIMKVGNAHKLATRGKKIQVAYYGTLMNGKKFDSGTFAFTVGAGEVVAGFDKGVEGMMLGEKRRILIPAKLGYGSKRMPGIPPNSNLIFEITLNKVF